MVDKSGAIYDVEMQLNAFNGLVQRIVFYGCELYADQLKKGDDYTGRPSRFFDLSGKWNTLAGGQESPPCVSPHRRGIGPGFARDLRDSHAGAGKV